MINIKRVKDTPNEEDGFRVLVDRIWPVGMTKEKAKLDLWLKELGPSNGLRKWYGQDVEKWDEFKNRYFDELKDKDELINTIIDKSKVGNVSLLFNSKEHKYNNAAALKEYIEEKINKIQEKEKPVEKAIEPEGPSEPEVTEEKVKEEIEEEITETPEDEEKVDENDEENETENENGEEENPDDD